MKPSVVVTGCSRGLGLSITQYLLNSGYFVIGVARSQPAISSPDFEFISCDLSDLTETTNAGTLICKKYPNLYALVNNAAIGLDGLLTTQHNADITTMIQTNLVSPIILSKYLSRPMLVNSRGRIINISSIVANTGYRGLSAYSATKGGLISFTRSLARDLGSANITVNCIQPGFMKSEMTANLSNSNLKRITDRAALKSLVSFEDVASMVGYLLGDNAEKITGTSFVIDAGNSA